MLTLFYERVSTDKQSESGLGIEAQRRRNFQVATLQEYILQYDVVPGEWICTDDGVSRAIPFMERPQGKRLVAMIERERRRSEDSPIAVVTYSLERMFGDVDDGRAVLRWFDAQDVKVILSNEGGNAIDASSAMGRFLITIRLAQGEFERGVTAERTRAALGALRDRGGKIGEAPYGWRAVGDGAATHVQDADEQETVAKILRLDAAGVSMRGIADQLNRWNILTRDGKQWRHNQVSRILQRKDDTE